MAVDANRDDDVDRWKQIEALYGEALACAADQRDAYLKERCADPDLRGEVASLLRANDEAGRFLSSVHLATHLRDIAANARPSLDGGTLGPYANLALIGSGATGDIYRARDSRLGRQVALKVLHSRFTHDPASLSRFMLEAKAASALNHPNIITVHEIGDIDSTHFIATELIAGVSLRQRLAIGRPEVIEALDVAIQCAAALDAGHQADIVHRDIKPENIMLRPDGLVKVVDFGLARTNAEAYGELGGRTLPGVIMGTPRYMSPEQARGWPLDPRTDIFSLGAVLFEMLVGQPRFAGESTAEVFASLLGPEDFPEPAVERLPGGVRPIVEKALAKDRDRRYQTINALGRDLRDLRQRLTVTPEHPVRSSAPDAAEIDGERGRLRRGGPGGCRLVHPAPHLLVAAVAAAGALDVRSGLRARAASFTRRARVAYTRERRGSAPEVVVQQIGAARTAPQVVGREVVQPGVVATRRQTGPAPESGGPPDTPGRGRRRCASPERRARSPKSIRQGHSRICCRAPTWISLQTAGSLSRPTAGAPIRSPTWS